MCFYRLHPKDGGRQYFHFVCQSMPRQGGGYPITDVDRGYPIPGLDGVHHHRSGGGLPHPRSGLGIPHLRSGWGYPILGLDGMYPGVPSSQVWMVGVPRVPPARSGWWGVPGVASLPRLDGVPPPIRQSSIASTCYPAGGMPLAFTHEDFLVFIKK